MLKKDKTLILAQLKLGFLYSLQAIARLALIFFCNFKEGAHRLMRQPLFYNCLPILHDIANKKPLNEK